MLHFTSKTRRSASLLATFLAALPTGSAATLNVPADRATIQAAIDAATPGDTISVAAGTYRESLSWSHKDLIIVGAGAATTIIDPRGPNGERGGACLETWGLTSASRIEGFTLTGGIDTEIPDPNGHPVVAGDGGGIVNTDSSPTVANCVITGNQRTSNYWYGTIVGGGGISNLRSSPTIIDCLFSNNGSSLGGAMYNSESNPTVIGCTFRSNSDWQIHNVNCAAPGASFVNCTIDAGQTGMWNESGTATVTNSSVTNLTGFYNVHAFDNRGGILALNNCAITKNISLLYDISRLADVSGPAIRNAGATVRVTNCTIADNRGGLAGAGILGSGTIEVTNSIVWNNRANSDYYPLDSQNIASFGTLAVNHSNIETSQPWTGTGNLNADPLFANAAAGDYRLRFDSPCVDAGDGAALPPGLNVDLAGNPRISGYGCDMGAFEFTPCTGDINKDGQRDLTDLSQLLAAFGASEGDPGYNVAADLNRDNAIGLTDLSVLLAVFGQPCP